jgi:hypothetical protein
MKFELAIIPGTRIALFRSLGSIEFEDRMRNVEHIAQFCNVNSITHLIIDIRQQVSKATTIQMFNLGTLVPKAWRGILFAVVCQSSDIESQFGETVAANRGAISHLFTTVEEAQKWLERKGIAPNKPDAGDA